MDKWIGRWTDGGVHISESSTFVLTTLEVRGQTGRAGCGRQELCCLSCHSSTPALSPAFCTYLFGPKLQGLLPGFLKVFLLADVGLWSRNRGQ